ncbi:hypothetical protein AHAS_Ahas16G0165400 [Arachis hypogaea]
MSGRAEATSGGRAKSTRGGRVSNTWGHSAHVSCNDSLVLQYVTYVLGARPMHIGSNFLRAFKAPHLQKLVVNIGYSRTVEEYNFNYKRLKEQGEAYAWWCDAIEVRNWVYVNDVYKMSEVRKVYQNKFVPLGDLETWPAFLGPTLVANPTLRQTSKGGLKLTRYLNEMDSREMRGPQICRLSGRQGHSHSRCPQRAGLSGVSGSGGP